MEASNLASKQYTRFVPLVNATFGRRLSKGAGSEPFTSHAEDGSQARSYLAPSRRSPFFCCSRHLPRSRSLFPGLFLSVFPSPRSRCLAPPTAESPVDTPRCPGRGLPKLREELAPGSPGIGSPDRRAVAVQPARAVFPQRRPIVALKMRSWSPSRAAGIFEPFLVYDRGN